MRAHTATGSHLDELLGSLAEIARRGPIRTVREGSTGVGMTLLDALGVRYTSTGKPNFRGIVVTARRESGNKRSNRVNLFARVPDWDRSALKSSGEIVARYGYDVDLGHRKLYCTVRAKHPNSQGLFLRVQRGAGILEEMVSSHGTVEDVVVWSLRDLEGRLVETHPESVWVRARVSTQGGREYFHFRHALYTPAPSTQNFVPLLEEGTVTVDHLIEERDGRVREKGPLFKINPPNIGMLFPSPASFDLMNFGS